MLKTTFGSFFAGLVIALLIVAGTAHCAINKKHENSLGLNIPYENPYTYMFGSAVAGNFVQDSKGKYHTNMRFQPYGTFSLYSESILFCGEVGDQFNSAGFDIPLVITYKRVAHQSVQGIGCHELEHINKVVGEELP